MNGKRHYRYRGTKMDGGNRITSHYKRLKLEPDDVIARWNLNFRLGNIIKYTARANHKGQKSQDLCKVVWYAVKELTEDTELADQIVTILTTPQNETPG